jgi:nucleotide-binding universal stress UspA family protein
MKNIYNTILVPTDFGERSLIALEESFNLSKITGLEITLLHVIRDNQNLFSAFGGERSKSMKKEYESQLRSQLQEIAADATSRSGTRVNAIVSHGKAYDKILKSSHLLQSRFIVQGINNEKPGSGKNHIGSNALRVINKAECPVITVKNPHSYNGCRSILLPLDLTEETRQKVSHGIEMAKIFGSDIKVVSVYWSTGSKSILNQLETQMKQVTAFIKKAGISCSGQIIEKKGTARSLTPMLLQFSEKHEDIDLIIIMTQKESGLFDLFLTSSAQDIITESKVPVMTIIPKQLGFISIMN